MRGDFAAAMDVVEIQQDFTEVKDNNGRDGHIIRIDESSGGQFPAAFQGTAESDFVGEFQAAAGGEAVGDAGYFCAFAGEPFGQIKTGGIAFHIGAQARMTSVTPRPRRVSNWAMRRSSGPTPLSGRFYRRAHGRRRGRFRFFHGKNVHGLFDQANHGGITAWIAA